MGNLLYRIIELQFFVLWLLAVVIPKNQFKVVFVSEILFFFVITVYNIFKIKGNLYVTRQGRLTWCLFSTFFVWAAIMLYLSYNNLPSYWNMVLLYYKEEYVFRHFMVIAELFLSIGLGYTMMKTQSLFKMKNSHLLIVVFLLGVLIIYNRRFVILLGGLYVAVLSLLAMKTRHKWLYLFVPFILISHSAYLFASALMLAFVFLKKPFRCFFSSYPTSRLIILIVISIVAVFMFSDELYLKIKSDPNSLWRLQVWTNEIESLAKTCYTGVGFGAAYVTSDIIYIVNNPNMYIDSDGYIDENIFLVANHNSVMNMFYRLGLLGGILFIAWNIMICSACILSYKKRFLGKYNDYCWWAFVNYVYNFVIIALNPGMEMMQFAINYTFSLGLMFTIIFSTNREIQKYVIK